VRRSAARRGRMTVPEWNWFAGLGLCVQLIQEDVGRVRVVVLTCVNEEKIVPELEGFARLVNRSDLREVRPRSDMKQTRAMLGEPSPPGPEFVDEDLQVAAWPKAVDAMGQPVEIVQVDPQGTLGEWEVELSFRVGVDREHVEPRPPPVCEHHAGDERVRGPLCARR
jgi:hypothetical protein